MENIELAVFSFNDKNKYNYINSRLCGLTGFEKDEIYSYSFPEPFWPNIFYSKIKNDINFFKSTGKLNIESFFMRKNKTHIPVKIFGSIIPAADNKSKEYMILSENISNQKKAERKLKLSKDMLISINKHLEKKVKIRTKQLQMVMKQKNEFINQLGHDLKNPLNPLENFLPILEQKENEPERKEMIYILKQNVNYIHELVVKMINLAKLDSLDIRFNFEKINAKKEIEEILERNIKYKNKKNIIINHQIEENIYTEVDIIHFHELITNIIDNSIKYGKENGIININCNKLDDKIIQIKITDDGIGMNNKQLQNVFKDFYKLNPIDSTFKSSGLGMSICERIVKRHNGKIWIESSGLGKGTSVFLTLPIKQEPTAEEDIIDLYNQIDITQLK